MSAEKFLTPVVQSRPASTIYGYPEAALVMEFQNDGNRVHLVLGSGDSGDAPGSLYNNAPNGSIYVPLTAVAGNRKVYAKFGAKQLNNGTWAELTSAALTAYVPYSGATGNVDVGTNRLFALKFTGRRDNGPGVAVAGPSHASSASAGADIFNYEGIFYDTTFNDTSNAGVKKNRCIIGGNLDMDMELQGPHMVRITAADNTVTGGSGDSAVDSGVGIIQLVARSVIELCPWAGGAAPHAATAKYLQVTSVNGTVFNAGAGLYTGGDIKVQTNSGLLYVGGEALAYEAKVSQASTSAPTVLGEINKTGQTATWAYSSQGVYTLTFGAAIATHVDKIKVFVQVGGDVSATSVPIIGAVTTSTSVITFTAVDAKDLALENALLTGASLRIVVTE